MKKALSFRYNLFIVLNWCFLLMANNLSANIQSHLTDRSGYFVKSFITNDLLINNPQEEVSPIKNSTSKRVKKEWIHEIIFIFCFTTITTLLINFLPLSNIYDKKIFKSLIIKEKDESSSPLPTLRNSKPRVIYNPTMEDKKLVARVHKKIVEERLYCNPELTLDLLANQLQVTRNSLSRAINHTTGKNFKKYINEYRVKEAIRLLSLPENQNLTLDGIIELAGFNSRSPFYETFKSVTGYTPTEYLRISKKKIRKNNLPYKTGH